MGRHINKKKFVQWKGDRVIEEDMGSSNPSMKALIFLFLLDHPGWARYRDVLLEIDARNIIVGPKLDMASLRVGLFELKRSLAKYSQKYRLGVKIQGRDARFRLYELESELEDSDGTPTLDTPSSISIEKLRQAEVQAVTFLETLRKQLVSALVVIDGALDARYDSSRTDVHTRTPHDTDST